MEGELGSIREQQGDQTWLEAFQRRERETERKKKRKEGERLFFVGVGSMLLTEMLLGS